MKSVSFFATCVLAMVQYSMSDVYMHNPRGSNNRLNHAGQTVSNDKRLFNSQNNARGGYNVGETEEHSRSSDKRFQYQMKYYMSGDPARASRSENGHSVLPIEWTNQHGCGGLGQRCDIILQYMCQPDQSRHFMDQMRDGTVVSTPTHNRGQTRKSSLSARYGVHEPWITHVSCERRERNKGLFTADQRLKGEGSTYTRQNPNGQRYGYECQEERDYYPYWMPTTWRDIAIMTSETDECRSKIRESFNVKQKGECRENSGRLSVTSAKHNNEADCGSNGKRWMLFANYIDVLSQYKSERECSQAQRTLQLKTLWAFPYRPTRTPEKECLVVAKQPECLPAPFSRPNHLGNAQGGIPLRYNWTLPYFPSETTQRCVLRIRYNISTADPQDKIKTDPTVKVLGELPLKLAINTAQFGRTFQDRSHLFMLKNRRTDGIDDSSKIHNLNIRGKRGNIVQTFPAVEYDFIPKRLQVHYMDYVHLQWTGSNTHPGAGEGRANTDRNNIVQMPNPRVSVPMDASDANDMFANSTVIWISEFPESYEGSTQQFLDLVMTKANFRSTRKKLQNQLDNASPSFEGAVVRFTERGALYYYMCTRNNNFTNRSQKGRIEVCKSTCNK